MVNNPGNFEILSHDRCAVAVPISYGTSNNFAVMYVDGYCSQNVSKMYPCIRVVTYNAFDVQTGVTLRTTMEISLKEQHFCELSEFKKFNKTLNDMSLSLRDLDNT